MFVVDKLTANTLTSSSFTVSSQTGASLIFTGADYKITTSGSVPDSFLSQITTAGKVSDSATTATSANTASAIVARDSSGDFKSSAISLTTQDAYIVPTSGNQSITANTPTTFTTWAAATVDQGSITRSSGTFTIGTAGTYAIACQGTFVANTNGWRQLQIVLNGSTVLGESKQQTTNTSNTLWHQCFCTVVLAVNDTITAVGQHSSTTTPLNGAANRLSIVRIH